jgi:adenine phosphoribosyltransferase
LPYQRLSQEYELEYGTDCIEVHTDAISKSDRILIVDDVLATGGTARAAYDLVKQSGAQFIALAFLMELDFLKGAERLTGVERISLIHYQ